MARKTKQTPLERIRANAAKTRAALVVNKDSAWHRFDQQDANSGAKRPKVAKKRRNSDGAKHTEQEASDSNRETSPDDPEFPPSWAPAGGHWFGEKGKTPSLGIARIPGWRVEKFAKAVGELLLELEIEDDFTVRIKTAENEGVERSTDIFVEFESAERAEQVKKVIDGKRLDGRVLSVDFGGV
ncbi:hypothetical protein CB0940_11012 [Cercospora beticola]|uniref:RRM domain-containing protein n=1 Tax=Cercospora beticola TaxID=122368 RepID=A0A2G5HE83_CERBT|nr:hypothetical protein CB0940_11012 [Cercospora beticola]PIA90866.1 hypothetical protein CB0940_11012 [Cercospora beticola]WPB07837.1 hypothetical protein RHO25_012501 [Cercospora beticola]CAK1368327.1 unnamed protein product [Cercospora beticola]